MDGMTIGQVASKTNISVETIRYYERMGLVKPPPRHGGSSRAGYRRYPNDTIERLRFIRRVKDLGFSLDEIRDLLSLHDCPKESSARVRGIATGHLEDVDRRIKELKSIRQQLKKLVESCDGLSDVAHCPIMISLYEGKKGKMQEEIKL